MRTIEVKDQTADAFVGRVKADLGARAMGAFVSIDLRGREIVLTFSRLGTSEMRFAVEPTGAGFRAPQSSEKIALAHRPFFADFEGRIRRVLEKAGARVTGP